jgi:hypothetical protein
MASDMRYYETFYGVHIDDWQETFATFSDHHKLLVKEYINEGCSTTTSSCATLTYKFLYPHHIKKTYFVEGVIEGHITFACSSATAYICAYRATLCKVHENNNEEELFTSGWVTVDDTLYWDSGYSIGDEIVYPFWIDAWNKAKIDENERLYLKVESTCTDNTNFGNCAASNCTNIVLWHSNDSTWEDIKIVVPFIM